MNLNPLQFIRRRQYVNEHAKSVASLTLAEEEAARLGLRLEDRSEHARRYVDTAAKNERSLTLQTFGRHEASSEESFRQQVFDTFVRQVEYGRSSAASGGSNEEDAFEARVRTRLASAPSWKPQNMRYNGLISRAQVRSLEDSTAVAVGVIDDRLYVLTFTRVAVSALELTDG